jgi:hypothetical protein
MKENNFLNLIARLEENFQELDSNVTTNLRKNDKQYATLRAWLGDLEQRHKFIEPVLEGSGEVHLTAEEHAGLAEYIHTKDRAESKERFSLYLAGHRDCFSYLKAIGVVA